MPHCILESSNNIVDRINKRVILLKVNECLVSTGLFNQDDIKSRFIIHNDYVIGDGDEKRAFVSLNVFILSGRSSAIRKMISSKFLNLLTQLFAESLKQLKFSLTVQITEIDKGSYAKGKSY